jgi:hypothetical protein
MPEKGGWLNSRLYLRMRHRCFYFGFSLQPLSQFSFDLPGCQPARTAGRQWIFIIRTLKEIQDD